MNLRKSNPNSVILLGTFIVASLSTACAEPVVLNQLKAVVNGEPITQNMVDQAVRTQVQVWVMGNNGMVGRSEATREIRKMEERALDDLIDRKLILSEFKTLGGVIKEQYIDESVNRFVDGRYEGDYDKFVADLNKSGMTISQFRDVQEENIAVQAIRSEKTGKDAIPNTPWELRRKYEEIKGDFASDGQPKIRIMSIPKETPESSPSQQEAIMKNVQSRLRSGADFGSLAKEYSADSYADKGGYIGVIGRNQLNSGLTQAAYSMGSGQVSPPMDDGTHWRIIKVDSRVGQKVPSFDELKDEVSKRLTVEKQQKKLETWLTKLRRDANVRIY
ncbi:MAG: peptidylprolyl isomerase [Verrucomicrobiales bacterium]|nr:peptidylprolyl isomerase [Verrucomicrobiales bacterium]